MYEAPDGPFENQIAPAFALKEQLITEIEKKLDIFYRDNKWVEEELYGEDSKNKKKTDVYGGTKVADIVFSFNNARLITSLRARGQCIAA